MFLEMSKREARSEPGGLGAGGPRMAGVRSTTDIFMCGVRSTTDINNTNLLSYGGDYVGGRNVSAGVNVCGSGG